MRIVCALTLAASLLAGTAAAQNFVTTSESNGVVIGFDRMSVSATSEGFATAQTVTVFPDTREADGARLDYVVASEVFDCANSRSMSLGIKAYRIGGAWPTITVDQQGAWQTHQPDMVSAVLLQSVCERASTARAVGSRSAEEFAITAREALVAAKGRPAA